MLRHTIALYLFVFSSASLANININFQGAKVTELIQTYAKAILKKDFVLGSDLSDSAPVTIQLQNKSDSEISALFDSILNERGIYKKEVAGVLYFSKSQPNINDTIPPEKALQTNITPQNNDFNSSANLSAFENIKIYQPMHIQPQDLLNILTMFGVKASMRSDGYVIYSPDKSQELAINNVFKRLDVPHYQYEVTAATYEVSTGGDSFRAIDVITDIFTNLSLSIVTGGASNMIKFSGGSLLSAFKFFDTDSRFRAISKPYAMVKSGGKLSFSSGQDVPTLGNIVTVDNVTTQGVEYRKSGVILDVELNAVQDAIDIKINHELSTFVPTKTGVNNSPTLNKRSLKTDLTIKDSEILVIGGLTDVSNSTTNSTALGVFPTERTKNQKQTETYIFLQVKKI